MHFLLSSVFTKYTVSPVHLSGVLTGDTDNISVACTPLRSTYVFQETFYCVTVLLCRLLLYSASGYTPETSFLLKISY